MTALRSSAGNEWEEVLRDGTRVLVRAIHPDDTELERHFIEALSPSSRRFRFLETMNAPSAALLRQMTVINPSTDAAYVALLGAGAQATEIGVARFSARADGHDCEFAVTVSDAWQNKGLGTLLMQHLIEVAKARGIKSMHSSDAADNTRMRQFADHLHFQHRRDPEDATLVLYSIDLEPDESTPGARLPPTRLENVMTQQTKGPQPKPGPVHPSPAVEATRQREKAEPAEVLGRHKNAGQKDHKGAL